MESIINFSEAKVIYSKLLKLCENKQQAKDVWNKCDTTLECENLIHSVQKNYCAFNDFLEDEFIECEGLFYNDDDYVMTREGEAILLPDAYFCNYYDEYTSEETSIVHIGRAIYNYCDEAINHNNNLHSYNNEFYDYDALREAELVIMHNGEIESECDVYYWESDNDWHYEPEEDDDDDDDACYLRTYHKGSYKELNFGNVSKFKVGFEIEKYDIETKESIEISDFEYKTNNLWRKESDSSLKDKDGNDRGGFELISPTFELNVAEIAKHIKANKLLVNHINADKNKTCGGHINVSELGKSGEDLFNSVKGYTPLFHALYSGRIGVDYSKGKSNERLLNENEKFQSIKIHENRIEYRIVSAVSSVDNLIWRAKLIDFIMNNQTSDIKQAFFIINTTLKPLLMQVYKTNAAIDKLMDKVIKYTLEFEQIELAKVDNQMFLELID